MSRNKYKYKVNMGSYQQDDDYNGIVFGLVILALVSGLVIGYVKAMWY